MPGGWLVSVRAVRLGVVGVSLTGVYNVRWTVGLCPCRQIGRGRRLEEENQAFRRRLETYQESQRQQAQVVAQLQDKVQQYKQRCAQLEDRMADSGRRLAAADQRTQERLQTAADRDHGLDLETALVRLEEAENRSGHLPQVTGTFRNFTSIDQPLHRNSTCSVFIQF